MKYLHNISSRCLVAAILAFLLHVFANAQVVDIPDAGLAAAVRSSLNQPDGGITVVDLQSLTTLYAVERGISDLSGLQHATNVTALYLWGNEIADIGPIAGLSGLRTLYLERNRVSNLGPLGGLTHLRILSLGENEISDLSPLSGLSALRWLAVDGNQVSDIGPLANLSSLQKLWINENEVADLAPLANLGGLKSLSVHSNYIDVTPGSSSRQVIDGIDGPVEFEPQYSRAPRSLGTQPMSISVRGQVGNGEASLIAGFSQTRENPVAYLIRGIGPALKQLGVSSALHDSVVQVHRIGSSGTTELVAENDNWLGAYEDEAAYRVVTIATERVGAFPLDSGSRDAVVYVRLDPGVYTVTLTGKVGADGVGLIEIYEVP